MDQTQILYPINLEKINTKLLNFSLQKINNKIDKSGMKARQRLKLPAQTSLVFIGASLAFGVKNSVSGYLDLVDNSVRHEFVKKSWEAVNIALDEGLIPENYQNSNDISLIADFVLRGAIIEDNPALQDVAKKVFENVRLKTEERPNGLDSDYPNPIEYLPNIEKRKQKEQKGTKGKKDPRA